MAVSKQEFLWREWRLGEGRYRGGGYPKGQPKPPSLWGRPTAAERPLWFLRLRLFLAKRKPIPAPPPSLGLLDKPFALYRNPKGGVENVAAAHAAGLRVVLLNVRDFTPAEWGTVITRAKNFGMAVGYWAHCFDVDDVERLLDYSERDECPLVMVNVEAELATSLTPPVLRDTTGRSSYKGQITYIVYGWVQNGVDLRPIGDKVLALEVFPQDDANLWHPSVKVQHCLEHARIQGAKLPVAVYGTYEMSERQAEKIRALGHPGVQAGDAVPGWYNRAIHHGLYTVDDTGEQWGLWGW